MASRGGVRWRKVLGDVRQHTGRSVLAVLAMATGLASGGAILNAWALVDVATEQGFLASDPPAATLYVDSVDTTLLTRVQAVPGVRLAEARRTVAVRANIGGATMTALLVASADLAGARIGRVAGERGEWPPRDGTMAIERSSLDFSGAAIGESAMLSFNGLPSVTIPVSGIVRDVTLAPGWMEHVVYAFVTPATLQQLGAPAGFDELRLVTTGATHTQDDVRAIAFQAKATAESLGHRVRDVNVPVPGEHIHAAQMDSLLFTQGAFAAMALVLSAFLVVNLMAAMLAGQTREIGIMKAIGARWQQIAALYLVAAGLIGLCAVVLALPVAMVAGRQYAAFKADLLNFQTTGVAIPLWALMLQGAVGLLLPIVAASVPVLRACRMSVGDALRDVGISGGGGSDRVTRWTQGWSRPLALSLRNTLRRRQRLFLTLLALASGGAVFLGALNLRASVRGVTDAVFAAQRYDFSLRLDEPQVASDVDSILRANPAIEIAEGWNGLRAAAEQPGGMLGNSFPITAVPPTSSLLHIRAAEGRWLADADRRALVINRALQRQESAWHLGASVRLLVDGESAEWTIVGVSDAGTGPMAYAPRRAMTAAGSIDQVTSVMVRTRARDAASQLAVIGELRASMNNAGIAVRSSSRVDEARGAVEDHLLMVVDFLGGMAWLMMLVGGLGLASSMGLAVLERTREIGVLRAIGASHRTILSLVQVEGLAIALASWLLAIPLSLPISVLLGNAFSRIMLPVPVTYLPNLFGVMIWLGVVLVVAMLACAWPSVRALRVPTAAALAYE